jgi:hypothetical protein
MPHFVGILREFNTLEFSRTVVAEQAEFNLLGMGAEYREVDTILVGGGSETGMIAGNNLGSIGRHKDLSKRLA